MSTLKNVLGACWTAAGHVWSLALDMGWAVWHEVQDGASRASWWLLLGLVALGGACLHAWRWGGCC